MTRRLADYSRPAIPPWTWVDTFLMSLIVAAIMVAAFMCFAVFLLVASPAHARDLGQWEGSNPIIRQWYKSLMQPDNPHLSCCGEADAYWADKVEVKDGKVLAIITDTRDDKPLGRRHIPVGTPFEVPPHKMTWKYGNPTGHVVIFIGSDDRVLCYVQNGGV